MRLPVSVAVLSCAALLSACAKDAPKTDSSAVAQAGASTTGAKYDPSTRVATIVAKDFAFEAPDSIPAGWTTLRLVNDGPGLHHVAIIRLEQGKTIADVQAALKNPGPPPAWMVDAGGVAVPDPKTEANATVDLKPGNYVVMCFVDLPDKQPHFTKGMLRPLTVTASTATGAPPTADIVVSLADYSFTVKSGTLTAGKHTVQVVNAGPQAHEIQVIRLATGKTMKDFGAWMAKMEGTAPVNGLGGIVGIAKGGSGYYTMDLTPGNYALACFVPDAKDGKTHLEHGMVKEFTVQ